MKLVKKPKLQEAEQKGAIEEKVAENKYNSLRDVMDYTLPFEMIYSAVENESYFNILYDMGCRNFLMSFHYIQRRRISMHQRFGDKNIRLFIDSGAFTYMKDPAYQDYDTDYWEKLLQKYLKFAEKNKEYIFALASFDYEALVGAETVERWNKEYLEPFMLRTGIPICFVWHPDSSHDWDWYCQRYPYVGFSGVSEGDVFSVDEFREKLRIAEKYDTLVHGFGMTRTAYLTELPFYTSDSTTWNAGLQFGEISYWNNNKMSRLKKTDWKENYLHEICSRYHIDEQEMLDETPDAMVRANIGAFIDAEKYVQERLRNRMYWLKAKTSKNDINDLSIYPDIDTILNGEQSLQPFAAKLNINPEAEEVDDLVYFATLFANWETPEYDELKEVFLATEGHEADLQSCHDRFINRIVPDDETRIKDLTDFFRRCITGECDTLLQLGTNFDREVKERDNYVEDDEEFDTVELSAEEVKLRLINCLPAPEDGETPEIDNLDKEIYSNLQIQPTFGPDGKLMKGQTKVRKPKKVYSNKYPKFACDTCHAAQSCKEYRAGYVCAFQKMFQRFDTRNQSDVISSIQGIVNHNMVRMQRAMVLETMSGNIDPIVSQLMDTNVKYMQMLNQLYETSNAEVLRQSRIVREDGTIEETTQVQNPQSGGILEKLFSNMLTKDKDEEKADSQEQPETAIIEAQEPLVEIVPEEAKERK